MITYSLGFRGRLLHATEGDPTGPENLKRLGFCGKPVTGRFYAWTTRFTNPLCPRCSARLKRLNLHPTQTKEAR